MVEPPGRCASLGPEVVQCTSRCRLRSNLRCPLEPPQREGTDIAESIALPLTDAFVIAEDECLIFFDRATAGDPELVAMKWRYFNGVEVVSRIEDLIADEVVGIPMKLVGP